MTLSKLPTDVRLQRADQDYAGKHVVVTHRHGVDIVIGVGETPDRARQSAAACVRSWPTPR